MHRYTKNTLGVISVFAAILAAGLSGQSRLNRVAENPFTKNFVYSGEHLEYQGAMGNSRIINADVTGDNIPDRVMLYDRGHAFFADVKNPTADSYYGLRYERIYPGTPEAERLQKALPNFRLVLPFKTRN